MLPGAVVARTLADLGAEIIKVEEPGAGEPLRLVPPFVGGVGVAFALFFRGAESVSLDLRRPADLATLRGLLRQADVMVESFRPGTLEAWNLGHGDLASLNPSLVTCSLTGFGRTGTWQRRAAHDLNLVAMSGLLDRLGAMPAVQIVDVAGGLLACSAILAGLLRRGRTGLGCSIDQPLAAAPLPFLLWAWGEAALAETSVVATLLGGACPAYRVYRCADGRDVAVGAVEPKFWATLVELLGLPQFAGAGLTTGEEGRAVAEQVAARFAEAPQAAWLDRCARLELPVSAVNDVREARAEPFYSASGLLEETPCPGGHAVPAPGPFLPALGRTPTRPAPRLGEHNRSVLARFGLSGPDAP